MHFVDAKGILSPQNGMNLYRGCTHGCICCDSRSTCYGFTHAFEDIEVKRNAPELLEKALRSKRSKCMISTGSMCDPYLHLEDELHLTQDCLKVIERYGFGVAIQTKSTRILRDIDLLGAINRKAKCVAQFTLTTADEALCRIIEPNVSTTAERIEALKRFQSRGIPTVVWITPLLPFINDTEENLRCLLDACISCGVKGIISSNFGLTLRDGDREYFFHALDRHFPGMKERYAAAYGNAYELPSPNADALQTLFTDTCTRHGILCTPGDCFAYLHTLPVRQRQLSIFGDAENAPE